MNVRNKKVLIAFGQRLQDVRLNKGLPREELSIKANISVGQIGRIERGEINTTLSSISALAVALEVEIKDLLDFSQPTVDKVKLPNPKSVVNILKIKLGKKGVHNKIKKKGGYFEAWIDDKDKGILVDSLGKNNLLEWKVFVEVITFLNSNAGKAERGNAMMFKLGEAGLSLKTVEGHLAKTIYKKKEGDSVSRRITPISSILVWAGICKTLKGKLLLVK